MHTGKVHSAGQPLPSQQHPMSIVGESGLADT